jgi:CheY-like chemotaxis protein
MTVTLPNNPASPLLLVEDSDEDYVALVRAIQQTGLNTPHHRCRDGDDALEYLRRSGRYADPATAPRPALILLDLNLPGTDGREVLQVVKYDGELSSIPVIVMTTSSNPTDIIECYRHGANGYQVKTSNYEGFRREIQRTVDYWFHTAVLPTAVE